MSKNAKNANMSTFGAILGGEEPRMFFSKLVEMKSYEHLELI